MTWLIENREWVFSGIGLLAFTVIGWMFKKKTNDKEKNQSIKSGNNSTNIQGSTNVRVRNGRVDDEG